MRKPILQTSSNAGGIEFDQKHILPGTRGLARKGFRRLRRHYRKIFQNRNYIFTHQGSFLPWPAPPCEFIRYNCVEDVPKHVQKTIIVVGGHKVLEMDCLEVKKASVMWAAILDQQLAGVLFIRRVGIFNDGSSIFRLMTS